MHSLAESFRLQVHPGVDRGPLEETSPIAGARNLLAQVRSGPDVIYLVNADSGYGKTVLGMTLATLRPRLERHQLVPLYIDLSRATSEAPLSRLEDLLDELAQARVGKLSGRPLFVLDALNEAVSPERFAEELANKHVQLDELDARLLFLFSFRHRSYPGKLRSALRSRGFDQLKHLELLFDVTDETDLKFIRAMLSRASGGPKPGPLVEPLQAYAESVSPIVVTREIAMAYLDWRMQASDEAPPPSPAHLLFRRVINKPDESSRAMADLARMAFFLLSEELVTAPYQEIAARAGFGETAIEECVAYGELRGWAHADDRYLRFANETTVRVLAALHVASELSSGTSPAALRGRTRYDVCAPYVLEAIRWTRARPPSASDERPRRASAAVRGALSGTDAPYSFYANVLSGAAAADIVDVGELDTHLFHEMAQAIDEDRGETCSDSLRAAGARDGQPSIAPVLDQIFGVVGIYGRKAVDLLLEIMDDDAQLIRSQGAYLLHHRLGTATYKAGSSDLAAAAKIPGAIKGADPNLHVRFHQVEILERLLKRLPDTADSARQRVSELLMQIADCNSSATDVPGCSAVYEDCQWLVSKRARIAATAQPTPAGRALPDRVAQCLSAIRHDPDFESIGTGAGAEARLECWEIALAFAIEGYRGSRRSLTYVTFVEKALTHSFWIVRWWAFGNLLAMLSDAGEHRETVLAARCARRAAQQLCTAVEPMGLKLRQCAVVSHLMASPETNPNARRLLSTALRERSQESLTATEREAFADAYYVACGSSPEDYLWEFWRRLEDIVPIHA